MKGVCWLYEALKIFGPGRVLAIEQSRVDTKFGVQNLRQDKNLF
jgi:hypothetical protein